VVSRRARCSMWLLAWALASTACEGDIDNDDFEGWVDSASGFVITESANGTEEHMLHTARFPCKGCYRSLPSFEDHETVLRFTTPGGRTLVFKWTAADLNEDVTTFPIQDIPAAIPSGGSWILPRAPLGMAAAYVGPDPFDEVGELEIVEAFWPQAPGDVGAAWVDISGASFAGRPVSGTLIMELAMRRRSEKPEGFGGRDQPCNHNSCSDGLTCVVEQEQMTCRLPCAIDGECGNAICQEWPGVGGLCRPAPAPGERGGPCLTGSTCSDGTICDVPQNPDRCRQPCDGEGFVPICGGSSTCEDDVCRPSVEAGLANGPCRNNVCDLPSLVCIAEEVPTCRATCVPGVGDDPCGIRFACAERSGLDAVCVPANLELEPCPCDDHLVCIVATGDPAGGRCRPPCTINPDGSDTCPDGLGRCVEQTGTPQDGVCIIDTP
jgi:hypothetical protein